MKPAADPQHNQQPINDSVGDTISAAADKTEQRQCASTDPISTAGGTPGQETIQQETRAVAGRDSVHGA